ncbi:MAG: recombinase family protein [Pseudonocardiales bacterium]|nr:recombinase family protein [Pseudonocardiales bacterium]
MLDTTKEKTTAATFIRVQYLDPKQRGLFSDLDRRLIIAAQDGSHKVDSAAVNKPQRIPNFTREQIMIDKRRRACEKMADKLNARIIREYVEYCGGRDCIDQRPTLQHMLHELDTLRDITYLIISGSLTQFTRRRNEMETILQKIDATGARLITAPSPDEGKQRLFRLLQLQLLTRYR